MFTRFFSVVVETEEINTTLTSLTPVSHALLKIYEHAAPEVFQRLNSHFPA